jgi:branched-chain amino acid transport system substrate-binding protein
MRSLCRRLPLFLLLAALGGACGEGRESPAIAFTYNFGDTAFQHFLQREIDRTRPPGGVRIRVEGAEIADWRVLAASALSAEVKRATELAADPDVVIAVGPGGSREALQVAPIYREARLVDLVPTATSRLLSTAGDYTFTLAPNDSMQGEFIGAFADTALGARSAAIFYVPDEYGIGLGAGTATSLASRGIALIDRSAMRLTLDCLASDGQRFYDGLAAELALRGTPDVVVIAARTVEAGCLARPLRARFPRAVLIAGDGTYLEEAFFVRAGAAAEGMHLVAFWHRGLPDSASRRFARVFAEEVKRRPRHGDAVFYDATMLAAAAIREGGADRVSVRRWMVSLGGARAPYAGITGPIVFRTGHRHTMLMTRVRGRDSEVLGR